MWSLEVSISADKIPGQGRPLTTRRRIRHALLRRLVHLFGRQQYGRPELERTRRVDDQRHSGRADIIRQVNDADDVVCAKGKVKGVDFASYALRRLLRRSAPLGATVLLQPPDSFHTIRTLEKVLWHGIPYKGGSEVLQVSMEVGTNPIGQPYRKSLP